MTLYGAQYAIVPARTLTPHEETDPKDVERLAKRLREDGTVRDPVIVDEGSRVILDGHHRFQALKRLGCSWIPCHMLDYTDPAVRVESWTDGTPMSKTQLVSDALQGELYPVKTSRHRTLNELPENPTAIDRLRAGGGNP